MNRERAAWLAGFLLLAIAAFRSPSAAQRDSDYLFVRTLVDINRRVLNHYVEPISAGELEEAAINGMLNRLDPYTVFVPRDRRAEFDRMLEGTFRGVGIELDQLPSGAVQVVSPIEGSPAHRAGVMAGDIILKVNGESIEGLRLPEVIKRIAGELGTEVRLTVRHATGEEVELSMRREEIVVPTVKGFRRKADNTWDYYINQDPKIAYVRITQFTPSTHDTVRPILEDLLKDGMRGLVLDLRWNPGGQLDQAVQVVDLFLEEGVIVVTRGRSRPEDVRRATADGTLPYFPMVVLINEHSASAAEIVAGSLMDNRRAAVLGQRSFGKGSVQEVMPLEGDNGELKLTVAYYYLPLGRLVHRRKDAQDWGVQPQVVVPMDEATQRKVTMERLASERLLAPGTGPATAPALGADVQLQRAMETLILMTLMEQGPAGAPRPATSRVAGGPRQGAGAR